MTDKWTLVGRHQCGQKLATPEAINRAKHDITVIALLHDEMYGNFQDFPNFQNLYSLMVHT
jgi:hypothetical protein